MTSYPPGHSLSQTQPRILWNAVLVAVAASVGVLAINGANTQNIGLSAALLALGVGAGVWGARSQRQHLDSAIAAAMARHDLQATGHLAHKASEQLNEVMLGPCRSGPSRSKAPGNRPKPQSSH
ncbi:hypothetical protein [Pseudomonas fluorescens]|uniref:hypothetical protein n=1 Tax=Pseudomonas fluorescens TaxID=294 RepID=UPI003D7B780F